MVGLFFFSLKNVIFVVLQQSPISVLMEIIKTWNLNAKAQNFIGEKGHILLKRFPSSDCALDFCSGDENGPLDIWSETQRKKANAELKVRGRSERGCGGGNKECSKVKHSKIV